MKHLTIICMALLLTLLAACAPPAEPVQEPAPEPEQVLEPAPESQPEPEPEPEPEPLDRRIDPELYKDPILYERGDITIAIPNKYADKLLIDPLLPEGYEHGYSESEQDKPLISVYHKASYDAHPGAGWLFSIWRYSKAQYEQFLTGDRSGQSFFARDDNWYYGFFFATDVQTPDMDDWADYQELFFKVGDFVMADIITLNNLQPYSDAEFFGLQYTYEGKHLFLRYYPYAAYTGDRKVVWTLVLAQPVRQGARGIWCVERWFEGQDIEQAPNIYICAPKTDKAAAEYYAELQAACDEGHNTAMLDPYQVGLLFANEEFGHDKATLESFELEEN